MELGSGNGPSWFGNRTLSTDFDTVKQLKGRGEGGGKISKLLGQEGGEENFHTLSSKMRGEIAWKFFGERKSFPHFLRENQISNAKKNSVFSVIYIF